MIYFVVVILAFLACKPLSVFLGIYAIKALPYGFLALGIIQYGLFNKGRLYIGRLANRTSLLVYGVFLLILMLSFIRDSNTEISQLGTYTTSLQYLLFAFYVYLFIVYHRKKTDDLSIFNKQVIFLLIAAPALFIFLDVILYLVGIRTGEENHVNPAGGSSVLGNALGLAVDRTSFVLGGHHNNFSLLIGSVTIFTVQALLLGVYSGRIKKILYFIIIVAGYGLILADVRGVVISLIIALVSIFLFKRLNILRLLPIVVILPFFISVSFPAFQLLLYSNADSLSAFARGGEEIYTLNGRTYIWEGCLMALSNFELSDIMGYGQVGHITSDAYLHWAWIFPKKVTHNIYFQYIFDAGYIGLLSLLAILLVATKDALYLYRSGNKTSLMLLAYLIYFPFSGIFESAIGVYNHPHTTYFLLVSAIVFLLKNEHMVHFGHHTT